jgi:GNAT superfamily N-acetyltransferase
MNRPAFAELASVQVAKKFTHESFASRGSVAMPAHPGHVMVSSPEIVLNPVQAEAEFWSAWLDSLAALPGDPYEAELRRFDDTVALFVHRVPIAYYNRVLLAESVDASTVEEVASFYRDRMMPCRFDMTPYTTDPDLLEALDAFGLSPAGFQSNLVGPVEYVDDLIPANWTVTEVSTGQLEFFADFLNRSYSHGERVPPRLMKFREATIRARHGRPGWHLYLCCVEGVPAAGAMLYVHGGVATLNGAATAPAFRGRGCQRALLRARINEAARSGCKFVVSRCGVGSVSQRNLERAGLQLGYTKVIWEHKGTAVKERPAGRSADQPPGVTRPAS